MKYSISHLVRKLYDDGELTTDNFAKVQNLTIYDHWLSEEEANDTLVSFSIFSSIDGYNKYLSEEHKFIDLFLKLKDKHLLSYFDTIDENLLPIESIQKLISIVTLGLREQQKFIICIEQLNIILQSQFDLNITVYILNKESAAPFIELTHILKLFLLE
jgi:hypothetical protein